MKKLTLLSAVALSCCAVNPTFAQVQILRSGTPTPAPRLISDQPNLVDPLTVDTAPPAAEAIHNPFDYFDQAVPQQPEPTVQEAQQGVLTDVPTAHPSRRESEPASVPVGDHHRPSIVDTIVSQEMVGNIPHASSMPVFWGGVPQTPNPVAEWLLRQDCVDGLWASYPQQRAAECAHMWSHIAGHHACGCAAGHCGTVTTTCSVCSSHAPTAPRNRYLERSAAAPANCEGCASAAPVAACDSGRPDSALPGEDCTRCAQLTASEFQAAETPAAPKSSVAKLPTLGWFR